MVFAGFLTDTYSHREGTGLAEEILRIQLDSILIISKQSYEF